MLDHYRGLLIHRQLDVPFASLTDSINGFPGVSLHHGMNPNIKRPIIPLYMYYLLRYSFTTNRNRFWFLIGQQMNLIYSTKSKTVWQENHMSFEQHKRVFFWIDNHEYLRSKKWEKLAKMISSVVFMINDKASKYIANGLKPARICKITH